MDAQNVVVTESAIKKIAAILGSEKEPSVLRVSVEGGGCSGFQYKFDIQRAPESEDVVIARNGATVVIDPVSLQYLAGSRIDYADELIGAAFKIDNPNATASCGCGTSFSL
ncbi:MAG: iron-sulfur cluster insertion protein ErpA [Xanthobacteraceae bacterium]|jgi:iron-sulfur cluster assembly accessory protein|nr:iron-sulfur cluster insertion protein ErpA [Xanthobacteraceae bacterium]